MIIEVKNLTKRFNGTTALDDVTLSIKEGEVFGLLGPNGAGKTTLIRILLNILNPTSGEVRVLDCDVTSKEYDEKRKQIGFLLENIGLNLFLTGYKNMEFFDRIYNKDASPQEREERIKDLLTFVGLWEDRDRKPTTYSLGMGRRLAMARALINNPSLIFLDEPTLGLDPEARMLIREMILALKKEGKTIFMSSHDLDEVQRVCTKIALLKNGKLLGSGSYDDLNKRFGKTSVMVRVNEVGGWVEDLKNIVKSVEVDGNEITVECQDPSAIFDFFKKSDVRVLEMKNMSSLEDVYLKMVESEPERRTEQISMMKQGKRSK